jgi:hypothetical protein
MDKLTQMQRNTLWPAKFDKALDDYCSETGETASNVLRGLVQQAIKHLPESAPNKILKSALDSFENVKRGRPAKDRWELRKDIAGCIARGITVPYQITKEIGYATYEMVVGQLERHQDEIDRETARIQRAQEKSQASKKEAEARRAACMKLRAMLEAGTISKEQYDIDMKVIADQILAARAEAAA